MSRITFTLGSVERRDRGGGITPPSEPASREERADRLGGLGPRLVVGAAGSAVIILGVPSAVPFWCRAILAVLGGLAAVASLGVILDGQGLRSAPFDTGVIKRFHFANRWTALGSLPILALVSVAAGFPGVPRVVVAGVILLAPGYIASRLLAPEAVGGPGRLALAWAMSAGLVPLPLALLNWAGVPFSLPAVLLSLAFVGTILGVARWKSGPVTAGGRRSVEAAATINEHLLVFSAVGLTVLLAALPYLVRGSPFPFGRDYQHPVNVARILSSGWPWPQPGYIHRTYPDSFAYLASAVAALAGWTPLQVLQVLPVVSVVGGALALYCAMRGMFGRTPAAFTLLAYGALSYQPRSNFFFGTFIDLVAGLTFVPLFFWMLTRTTRERGGRGPLLAGLLAGFIIQYHLLTTTITLAVSLVYLLGIAVCRRELLTTNLLRRLGVVAGIAALTGLPFSLYYTYYYITTGLSRLGIIQSSLYDVTYPAVRLPKVLVLGGPLYLLLPVAAVVLLRTRRQWCAPRPATMLLGAWIAVLLLGSFTKVFVDPARSTYLLALPVAALIGLTAQAARRSSLADTGGQGRPGRLGILVRVALVLIVVSSGIIFVAGLVTAASATNRFAEARDLPSLRALQRMWQDDGMPRVLTDESGLWAHYFTDGQAYVLPGGPAGFNQWYPRERERFEAFWAALQEPCASKSFETFQSYQVRFIYLGAKPRHWTKQGYEYNDGSGLLACSGYTLSYAEDTADGPIRIFRVDGR
ncbi:MAG: hypothetical protein HYX51_09510 [Chloroflexi bacterium]|nr:hypothetical protein [Chloroflexota bacterium]